MIHKKHEHLIGTSWKYWCVWHFMTMYGKASKSWCLKLALLQLLWAAEPHLTGCQRLRDADGCIWVLPGRWGLALRSTVTTSKCTRWCPKTCQVKPCKTYQLSHTISRSLSLYSLHNEQRWSPIGSQRLPHRPARSRLVPWQPQGSQLPILNFQPNKNDGKPSTPVSSTGLHTVARLSSSTLASLNKKDDPRHQYLSAMNRSPCLDSMDSNSAKKYSKGSMCYFELHHLM